MTTRKILKGAACAKKPHLLVDEMKARLLALPRSVAAIFLCCATLATTAKEFVWQGNNDSSWKNPASYANNAEEALPGENDKVVIPDGSSATVRDAEVSFVSGIGDIELYSRNTFTFDVSGDYTVNCPIHQPLSDITSKTRQVVIVKKGIGSIELAHVGGDSFTVGSNDQSYRASIRVEAGTLKLCQLADASTADLIFAIVSLEVYEGAKFYTAYNASTFVNGAVFSGGGMITNASPEAIRSLTCNYSTGSFSGTIAGNIALRPLYAEDTWLNLLSPYSTYTGDTTVYNGGRLGVMKFGRSGEPSSIGSGSKISVQRLGGTLLALGNATESTNKEIEFDNSTPSTLDAGAFGGVTFEGGWYYKSSSRMQHILNLTGSNTTECVIANSFTEPNLNGAYNYGTYIRKKGSGIWRMANHSSRANRGAIAVEDGTLRFDSVAEAGSVCSLGLATVLKEPASADAATASVDVPYAVCIGGESTEGTFEYTGSGDVDCSTRPIAVKGTGRLRNATDCGFRWQNVFGWGTGANSLTLDGDSLTAENVLDTVTNANGTLSIVKDGLGTWILDGDQTFSGKVAVKSGTLLVRRSKTHPTWFRFTVTGSAHETAAAAGIVSKSQSTSQQCMIEELAYYDAAGNRLNSGFTYVTGLNDITELEPGQVALDGGTRLSNSSRTPNKLCDGLIAGDGCHLASPSGCSGYFNIGSPSTWCRVVMRLADDAAEVTAYDFANYAGSGGGGNRGRSVETYRIETSVDGVTWTIATNVTGRIALGNVKEDGIKYSVNEWPNNGAWNSDGVLVSAAPAARPGKGYPLNTHIRDTPSVFDNVTTVSVAEGAVLRADVKDGGTVTLSGLTINPDDGVGTIDGFRIAERGTITLASNISGDSAKIQYTFQNVEGLANLANWDFAIAEGVFRRIHMSVDAATGAIHFSRPGMKVLIR